MEMKPRGADGWTDASIRAASSPHPGRISHPSLFSSPLFHFRMNSAVASDVGLVRRPLRWRARAADSSLSSLLALSLPLSLAHILSGQNDRLASLTAAGKIDEALLAPAGCSLLKHAPVFTAKLPRSTFIVPHLQLVGCRGIVLHRRQTEQ